MALIRSSAEMAHLAPRIYANEAECLAEGGPCEVVILDLEAGSDESRIVAAVMEKAGFDAPWIVMSDGSDPQSVVRAGPRPRAPPPTT